MVRQRPSARLDAGERVARLADERRDKRYRDFGDRFLAALRVGDVATLGAMLDPDFEVVEADSLPYGGTYRGIDGWRALTRTIGATFAGFRLTLLDYVGETAGSLVVHFATCGRVCATGVPFDTRVLEYWRFRNNLLWRIDPFYFDTHVIVSAVADG